MDGSLINKLHQLAYGQEDLLGGKVQLLFTAIVATVFALNLTFGIGVGIGHIEPLSVILIQLCSFLLAAWLFVQGRFKRRLKLMTGSILWLIALVWIPVTWVFTGGMAGPTMMTSLVLFTYSLGIRSIGIKTQLFGCCAIVLSPLVMYLLERSIPNIIVPYPSDFVAIAADIHGYVMMILFSLILSSAMLSRFRSELKRADMLGYELRELMTRDSSTNVLSHDAILEVAKNRLARQDAGSLFMLDVDRIRQFKDGLGERSVHVLFFSLGRVLQEEALKSGAEVGRLGSGEFLMVLPENRKQVLAVDNRVRKLLSFSGLLPCPVTYSGGIVHWECGHSLTTILNRVDDAVCTAKSKGGNNTVVITS